VIAMSEGKHPCEMVEYFNSLVYGLKKQFFMQRAHGATFRTVFVGMDYLSKLLEEDFKKISEDKNDVKKVEEHVRNILRKLAEMGIIKEASVTIPPIEKLEFMETVGTTIKVNIKGCVHHSIDKRLANEKVPPIVLCPIVNILIKVGELMLGASEGVSAEVKEDGCDVEVAAFTQ